MVTARRKPYEIQAFKGLRNDIPQDRFEPGDLSDAVDIDLDTTGMPRTRLAPTLFRAGAAHSGWSDGTRAFFVSAGDLVEMLPDLTTVTRQSGLLDRPVSYASCAGTVFWSNGAQTGSVRDRARGWGIDPPAAIVPGIAAGNLPAGTYLLSTAFVRDDGLRSGAAMASSFTVPADSALSLTLPASADPDVVAVVVFVTPPSGEVMREVGVAPPGSVFEYGGLITAGAPVALQFKRRPPAGDVIGYHAGRLYIGQGDVLWHTDPLQYHHVDARHGYVPVNGQVTMLATVEGGLFVGTDRETVFLEGTDPAQMFVRHRSASAVLRGSLVFLPGALVFDGSLPISRVPFWTSATGVCAGLPDGSVREITAKRFTVPSAVRAAGGFKQRDGSMQYLANLFDF